MLELLNVLGAAIAAYAFGAAWYIAMSRPWVRAAGIAVDTAGKPQGSGSPLPFIVGFFCILVVAGMLRHVFQMAGVDTLGEGIGAGLGVGAFVITPWVVMNYTYAARPVALALIDSVYAVVGCGIIGAVLMLF